MRSSPAAARDDTRAREVATTKDEADDRAVRRVYLVLLAIPLAIAVAMWAVGGLEGTFQAVVVPTIVVVHGTVLVGLASQRLSLRAVRPWVVLSPTLALVARLVTWEVFPATRPDGFGLVIATVAWFGVLFALAFLVFGTRRGAIASLVGFALVYIGAGWSAAAGMLVGSESARLVVFLAASHAALIAVVWVLARNVEILTAARARAHLMELQATTDPLTGVANRRRLDDELQGFVARARRHEQALSVVLVDLDHFKTINDTFGHDLGDQVLVQAVERMLAVTRRDELLGRWGGEEFLLLAPQTDHASALALAERCRRTLAESSVGDDVGRVTASFGVATLGPDDEARLLMNRADLALYTAKAEGRNRVVGIPDLSVPAALDGALGEG